MSVEYVTLVEFRHHLEQFLSNPPTTVRLNSNPDSSPSTPLTIKYIRVWFGVEGERLFYIYSVKNRQWMDERPSHSSLVTPFQLSHHIVSTQKEKNTSSLSMDVEFETDLLDPEVSLSQPLAVLDPPPSIPFPHLQWNEDYFQHLHTSSSICVKEFSH